MTTIQKYVDKLFRGIPKSDQRERLKSDIKQNLLEKVWDLVDQGKLEQDAINEAIVGFGDIDELRRELGSTLSSRKYKALLQFCYSLIGSLLIILLVVFTNLYYTPDFIWFVYPTFGVLWWPLSMAYHWLNTK